MLLPVLCLMLNCVACMHDKLLVYNIVLQLLRDLTNQILTLISSHLIRLLTNSADSLIGAAGYLVNPSHAPSHAPFT